jgi:ribosomal protein S18 acetylase RimI-like enzyme
MNVAIRSAEARDQAAWRRLWDGYCAFYEIKLPAATTDFTWARILDAASPVRAIVAETPQDGVIGICNFILHENTWETTPVCYLEDLFVDPACRAVGVGKQLIDALVARMADEGWSRLYWRTRETNYRARGLYDKYVQRDGFVTYVVRPKAS